MTTVDGRAHPDPDPARRAQTESHTMDSSTDTIVRPDHTGPTRARLTARQRWQALPALTRSSDEALMGPRARIIAAAVTLAVLVLGLGCRLAGLDALGSVLLVAFASLGTGVAGCLTVGRLTGVSFVVYAAATGLAASTGIGFLLAETGFWYPRAVFTVVAVVVVALLVLALRRDLRRLRSDRRTLAGLPTDRSSADRHHRVVTGAALLGLVLAGVDAAVHAGLPQPAGLIGTVGPVWYLGCLVVVAALVLALRWRVSPAAPVLVAATVVIFSQALLYGAPTVMAAGRHLGLTAYIRVNGSVDAAQDIYQAWPGLFAGSAWLLDGTGAQNALALATWWPVVATPLVVLAVRLLAGRFLAPGRAWLAAAVYGLGDALNSTYFAPQVFGFFLAMTVLGLLVAPPAGETASRRRLRTGFVLALIVAVVVTHQITPFLLTGALLALVVFRLVRPWWVPLLALVPAVGWALLHQRLLARYVDLGAIGSLFSNIAPPEHPDTVAGVVPVTRLVFYVPAAALVLLGLVALAVVLRRRDRLHLGLAAAVVSPLALALGTDYGQEGIFRIVLFAVPWLGILLASARLRPVAAVRTLLVGAFVVMMAVNTYGQTGLDWARVLRPGDAQVIAAYERTAADNAVMLSLGTKNATPTRITERYDRVGYTSRLRVGGISPYVGDAYDPSADLANVTQAFTATYAPGGHYLYVSDAIGAYDDRYGLQHYADYLRLEAAVAASPAWVQVQQSDTATLYKLRTEPVGSHG